MNSRYESAIGDPVAFVNNMTDCAKRFPGFFDESDADNPHYALLTRLRKEAGVLVGDITQEPERFRIMASAFAALIIDYCNYDVKVAGLFKKRLVAVRGNFKIGFIELMYRALIEGADIVGMEEEK